MAATPVSPGWSTFPSQAGHHYLLSGIVRGSLSDQDVVQLLSSSGFSGVVLQSTGAALPDGWPTEELPPLSDGERYFHAAGTWTLSSAIPTAFTISQGAVVVFQLWEAPVESLPSPQQPSAYVRPVSLFSGATNAPSSWSLIGGVLGLLAAGTFFGLAVFKQRQR